MSDLTRSEIDRRGKFVSTYDEEEIREILESYGYADLVEEVTCLYLMVGDGFYEEIWACDESRPYSAYATFYQLDLTPPEVQQELGWYW
jgi:hypothetical protein